MPANQMQPYLTDLSESNSGAGPLVGFACLSDAEIRFPDSSLRKHTIIVGSKSVGKSAFIQKVLDYKLERKAAGRDDGAVIVISADSDLIQGISKAVPTQIVEKVRLLDFGGKGKLSRINVVDHHLFPHRDQHVDNIINCFKHDNPRWGNYSEDLLRHSLLLVYVSNANPLTKPEDMLTLFDIPALLNEMKKEQTGRIDLEGIIGLSQLIRSKVNDPHLIYWFNSHMLRDQTLVNVAVSEVSAWIEELASNEVASIAVDQELTNLDLSGLLADGMVLLVSLDETAIGTKRSALLGSAMIGLAESYVRNQQPISRSEKVDCFLVCDEIEKFPAVNWTSMLSDSEESICPFMLTTTSLVGLDSVQKGLRAAVLTGTRSIVGFQMDREDAQVVSLEMDPKRVEWHYLSNLQDYQYYLKTTSDGYHYPPLLGQTLPPIKVFD